MFKVSVKGFDQVRRKLDRLQHNAERMHGEHQVPVVEMFHDEYMARQTRFSTLSAMLDTAKLSAEEFLEWDDAPRDEFVRSTTRFASWDEMRTDAASEWMRKQLLS